MNIAEKVKALLTEKAMMRDEARKRYEAIVALFYDLAQSTGHVNKCGFTATFFCNVSSYNRQRPGYTSLGAATVSLNDDSTVTVAFLPGRAKEIKPDHKPEEFELEFAQHIANLMTNNGRYIL